MAQDNRIQDSTKECYHRPYYQRECYRQKIALWKLSIGELIDKQRPASSFDFEWKNSIHLNLTLRF